MDLHKSTWAEWKCFHLQSVAILRSSEPAMRKRIYPLHSKKEYLSSPNKQKKLENREIQTTKPEVTLDHAKCHG